MTERPRPQRRGPDQPGQHPLLHGTLPEWLAAVTMPDDKPVWVPFDDGKRVPLDLLTNAMSGDVGTLHGSFVIPPEIGHRFAQHTERPGWRHLPSELTTVKRVTDMTFEVRVGDYRETFGRDEIEERVIDALLPPDGD